MFVVAVSEFDTSRGAEEALQKVNWEPGQKKPEVRQPHDTARRDIGVLSCLISEVRENA